MTRTAMPGMSPGAAPLRRIRLEAAGSAIRDRYVPSGRTSRTGRSMSLFARHSTCTPAASDAPSRPWDRKFRSASSRSPGRAGQQLQASGCSPVPAATAPPPAPPGSRTRPGRRPGPAGTAPGRRRCPGSRTPRRSPAVAGTSRHIPSIATSRIPATQAVSCSSPASGPATASSSLCITCQPSRWRAWVTAAGEGCMPSATRTRNCLPTPGPAPACSIPRRSRTGRTAPSPAAGTPPPARAASACAAPAPRPHRQPGPPARREHLRQHPDPDPVRQPSPATTCCPRLATQAILHRCSLNLTPLG